MSDSFTVFGKFGDAYRAMSDEDRTSFARAVIEYGCFGEIDTDLTYAAGLVLDAIREDIDNSKDMRQRAQKGGRPRKQADAGNPQVKTGKNQNVKLEKTKSGNRLKPESEIGKNQEHENPETQTKPDQSKPDQDTRDFSDKPKSPARAKFAKPTVDEIRAYCREKGYTFSPESFVAHYEANGWRVGRNPMKNWRAACSQWQQRQGDFGGAQGLGRDRASPELVDPEKAKAEYDALVEEGRARGWL